jgi:maleate isomerase
LDKLFKVGLVLPEANTIIIPEMYSVTSQNVSFHAARLSVGDIGVSSSAPMDDESLERMMNMVIAESAAASRQLKPAGVNLVVLTVTAASYVLGPEKNQDFTKQLAAAGAPATTAARSLVKVLRSQNIKKISLGTPVSAGITKQSADYLKKSGFEVLNRKGLVAESVKEAHEADFNVIASLVKDCLSPEAEAVAIFGTLLPTLNYIGDLETRFGLPIVSTSLAIFWHSMKLLDVHCNRDGKGILLPRF